MSRAWRRSSTCRRGCRSCYMSRSRPPAATRGSPCCWTGSGRRRRSPIATFSGSAELGRLVRDDLAALLSERFATTGVSTRAWPGSPRGPRPLPVSTTTLFGREQEIGEVAGLLARPGVRLVTLTGPGGVGKTRLAVAVAGRLRESFGASTVFVSLAVVTDPGLVLPGIGRAVGADLAATPLEALAERLGDERWLLILDNLEQVVGAAADLGKLLARGPGVVILATSRIVLGLQGDRSTRSPRCQSARRPIPPPCRSMS